MIEDIRRELLQQYEEKQFLQTLRQREVQNALYGSLPALKELEEKYRAMELEILKTVFSSPHHARGAAKEQQRLHEALERERIELLAKHGLSTDPRTPVFECPHCKDTGYQESGSYCRCFKEKLSRRVYSAGAASTSEHDLASYSLEVFEDPQQKENMQKLSEQMREEARLFKRASGRNYLFSGPISQGKTYLMESFAGELLKEGYIVYAITAPGFVDFLRKYRFSSRQEPRDEQTYDLIMNSDLLLLDDLGKENVTDFVVTEFFNLINHRYLKKKSLFISTNLEIKEMFRLYDEASWSRILGNAYVPRFFGPPLKRVNK